MRRRRGLRVTGSELVGLIPLNAMLDAEPVFPEEAAPVSGCFGS